MTVNFLKMLSDSRSKFEVPNRIDCTSVVSQAAMLIVVGLGLSSCVISDKPIIANGKPLLGQQFAAVLYRDFSAGKGYAGQQVAYRWSDGGYLRESVVIKHMVKFVAEPLEGKDFLIERSQPAHADASPNVYTYWIGRQVSDGAYLVFPINENDLAPTERSAICAKDAPEGLCTINNHEQLMTLARATASKPPRDPAVAILVDESLRTGKSLGEDQTRP